MVDNVCCVCSRVSTGRCQADMAAIMFRQLARFRGLVSPGHSCFSSQARFFVGLTRRGHDLVSRTGLQFKHEVSTGVTMCYWQYHPSKIDFQKYGDLCLCVSVRARALSIKRAELDPLFFFLSHEKARRVLRL